MAIPIQTIAHAVGEATRTVPTGVWAESSASEVLLAPPITTALNIINNELTRAQLSMVRADVEVLTGAAQALIHSARAIGGAIDQFIRLK